MNNKPNLLALIIAWVNDLLPDYQASTKIPKQLPATFSIVKRVGGTRRQMVLDMADIEIQIYDKNSELDCSNIADFVADMIPSLLAEYDDITHAEVTSVVQLNDYDLDYNRYTVSCSIYYRR